MSIDTEIKWVTCRSCEGLGEVDPDDKLDVDDLAALRKELTDTVTMDSEATGLSSARRGERIRTAARIAWLASRIGWLEACEVIKADDEAKWAAKQPIRVDGKLAIPQEALDEAHAFVEAKVASGGLVRMAGGGLIESSQYDPTLHGPKDCGHTTICEH